MVNTLFNKVLGENEMCLFTSHWWVTHKLENNNTKEILPLLWGSEPTSGFPAWGPNQRTGNPQGIWPWRPVGFDYKTSTGLGETETPVLERTNEIVHTPRPRGKEQWLHRRLNQNYLPVLEGLLWRSGLAVAHCRERALAAAVLGDASGLKSSWSLPLALA